MSLDFASDFYFVAVFIYNLTMINLKKEEAFHYDFIGCKFNVNVKLIECNH